MTFQVNYLLKSTFWSLPLCEAYNKVSHTTRHGSVAVESVAVEFVAVESVAVELVAVESVAVELVAVELARSSRSRSSWSRSSRSRSSWRGRVDIDPISLFLPTKRFTFFECLYPPIAV